MLKKILGLALVIALSVASITQGEEWIKTNKTLGAASGNFYLPEKNLKSGLQLSKDWGYEHSFDADSISVDKANKIVYVTMRFESFAGNQTRGSRIDDNVILHFNEDPAKCYAVYTKMDTFEKSTGKYYTYYYKNNKSFTKNGFSKSDTNPYYTGYTFWQDFAYLLDLPNQDGSAYIEPKNLKLNWATSTGKFGVFYDPKSLKIKGQKVSAKIYLWYPRYNRYQQINSTLNYDKNQWEVSLVEDRRLSDNTVTYKIANSLLFRINPSPFDVDEESKVVSEYFRRFL